MWRIKVKTTPVNSNKYRYLSPKRSNKVFGLHCFPHLVSRYKPRPVEPLPPPPPPPISVH